MNQEKLRPDGKKEYGYLYGCYLDASGRAVDAPMFLERTVVQQDVGERIILPFLKNYAIIPMEKYNKLKFKEKE